MSRDDLIARHGAAPAREAVVAELPALTRRHVAEETGAPRRRTVVNVAHIRRVGAAAGVPIAVLGDLHGPRIRVGEMIGGSILLNAGSDPLITPEPCVGTPEWVSVTLSCSRAT